MATSPAPPSPSHEVIADLPLEKVSIEAEGALAKAIQLARDSKHRYVGTEHVLLGVLAETGCLGAVALQSMGVTYETALRSVEAVWTKGRATELQPIVTTRVTNGLMQSMAERASEPVIDSGVLVEAMLTSGGIAGLILKDAGVTPDRWRAETSELHPRHMETTLGKCAPAVAFLWQRRGFSRIFLDRGEEARADFFAILGTSTSDEQISVAANNLAWTDLWLGDRSRFAVALGMARRAASKIPGDRRIHVTLAFALIENNRPLEGVDIMERVGVQGTTDWYTAAAACVLALGVARVGNKPFAEVLLKVADQLGQHAMLRSRVRDEVTGTAAKSFSPATAVEGYIATRVDSIRFHPKLKRYLLLVVGTAQWVFPMWIGADPADRIATWLKTGAAVPGRREWAEVLLADLSSRDERLTSITLDRFAEGAFRGTVEVSGKDRWTFGVNQSDAAMIALLTGLPIMINRALWRQYATSDPKRGGVLGRILTRIFGRFQRVTIPPRAPGSDSDPDRPDLP